MHRTVNLFLLLRRSRQRRLPSMPSNTIRAGSRSRVQAQERALEKLEGDIKVLMAEHAHLARPERLEPLARGLGLAPVAGRQYLRVDDGERRRGREVRRRRRCRR